MAAMALAISWPKLLFKTPNLSRGNAFRKSCSGLSLEYPYLLDGWLKTEGKLAGHCHLNSVVNI